MTYLVNNNHDRDRERQVCTWIDRQIHDEFEIIAKSRGMTKASLWRSLIEGEVERALHTNSIGGDDADQDTPAT